jgi:hypothetical protein
VPDGSNSTQEKANDTIEEDRQNTPNNAGFQNNASFANGVGQ